MTCRVPGAENVAQLWQLLLDGTEALTAPPEDRRADLGTAVRDGVMARAGYLADVAGFDAALFGLSPSEARETDPQQRLLLELCWEALEDAGIVTAPGAGVFVGVTSSDYALLAARTGKVGPHALTGSNRSFLANRLSQFFGFEGPSLVIDTAQSAGLAAVHAACESIRSGESDLAVAGGVQLNLAGEVPEQFASLGALSAAGRCQTFSATADGFARGEGGALFVLKPLYRALADNDRIHAVLRGSAVNHDGQAAGLTEPSPEAQARVLRAAYRRAGVVAEDIGYVELHGTGTPVGDPVEAQALGAVHGHRSDPLPVGSVKTNIGHLEAAAGAVGLVKAVLATRHRVLPASLNLVEPNPAIRFDEWKLRVVTAPEPWPGPAEEPVLAGVSAMGLGGTNVHLVVQSWPDPAPRQVPAAEPVVWSLSGHTEAALLAQARRLATSVDGGPVEIARSLALRAPLAHRAAVVGHSREELIDGIRALAAGTQHPALVRGTARPVGEQVVFVFPGQGSQWEGMARGLLDTSTVFAATIADCDQALAPWVDFRVADVLRGTGPSMARIDVNQPVLWAVMVALAAVWRDHGISPTAVVGQSQGEVAAACVAGALCLADGARLIATRAQAVARHLTGIGAMVWVGQPESVVRERIAPWGERLSVAVISGPESVVVAGTQDALDELVASWDVDMRRVGADYASHSPLVEPVRDELAEVLAPLRPGPSQIPFHSTVTGGVVSGERLDADYWYRNLREPVDLHATVRGLLGAGAAVFVEVSPHPILLASVRDCALAEGRPAVTIPTLRRDEDGLGRIMRSLAELSTQGGQVDWAARYAHADRIPLPHYAFQRRRYWLGEEIAPVAEAGPDDLGALVRREAAAVLGVSDPSEVDDAAPFREQGFDSAMLTHLASRIEMATGTRLATSTLFAHPSPERLAAHIGAAPASESEPATAFRELDDDPVVVVGIGCRFPGGIDSPETFWAALAAGADLVTEAPDDRGWRPDTVGYHGGFVTGATDFDPAFFGISGREALVMDPQQRLALETAWEALERAGLDPTTLRGSDTGVFLGAMAQDYGDRMHETTETTEGYTLTGTAPSVLSGRIAYVLGTEGPALTVDTACSSSLVALHLAARSLRAGECGLALAGGVTVLATPGIFVEFSRQGGLSPDGRCRSFSDDADGTGWGEGAGVLVLQRLSDALAQGREVLAVLRGSAINSDGASNGLTAPSGTAQRKVIRQALADAGLGSSDVDAVEAHGTGTRLGDPIEAEALLATYGRDRDAPLLLGSVKSNFGHTQAAAGVAGVIKLILALRHELLPRTLHADRPSTQVDWSAGSMALLTEEAPWPRGERPRRAAVSSFGISGTNAHVILEQPPLPPADAAPAAWPLVVSARSSAALTAQADRLAAHVAEHGLDGVASALVTSRPLRRHRAVVLGAAGLTDLASLDAVTGVARDVGRTVLVFPGQGAQWTGMGRDLMSHPVFAARMAECADALGWPLDDLFGELDRVDVVQPASFAVMVSLAAVWESVGLRPDAVLGHSQGEIAAACVAGALSLEDAARVVASRSRVIAEELAGHGGMLSVALAPDEIQLSAGVEIAAINGPRAVVLAGAPDALDELERHYREREVRVRRIPVDYASHTAHVDLAAGRIAAELAGVSAQRPRIPWLSTVDVSWIDDAPGPDYWVRNLRQPVRFAESVAALAAAGYGLFVESSAHPVLTAVIADSAGRDVAVAGTLRRDDGGPDRLLRAFAEVFTAGGPLDWTAVLPKSRPVALPTSVFERRRCWLGDPPRTIEPAPAAENTDLLDLVRRQAALVLGEREPIPARIPFREAGFDSLTSVDLRTRLAHATGVTLAVTAAFDHPDATALAEHLRERLAGDARDETPTAAVASSEPIAVVGMAVRLPGDVHTPEEFWQLLADGADAISGFPTDRGWDTDRLPPGTTRQGGFLSGAAEFDAAFFGISPREALAMDPQQRVFLESAWEALEDAGIDPTSVRGSATGVFVGATPQPYGPDPLVAGQSGGFLLTGTLPAVISGRVAYLLGTRGPAVTVDTACSSSLVALHLAAQSLRSGECATAVAGGVTVIAGPGVFAEFARQGGLAADGRCRAFGAGADGTGWAEGAGVLVLKRLSDAVREGRRVLAVIKGSAVNSDGASNGLTAPNGTAQQRVIRQALANAGLRPSDVDAVEAHGTGTRLGDPIEAQALLATYGQDRETPLWLGSVKSNVGHTQAAAGVTGVLKMILALRHGQLPRTLHAERRSELIDWSRGAVSLLTEPCPWPADGRPRRAGVSAFGVSGTNAHLLLEEAPAVREVAPPATAVVPLVVSARTASALDAQLTQLAEHVRRPVDLARPLLTGRATSWEHRAVVVAETEDEAVAGLREPAIRGVAGHVHLGFLFAGQGAQRAGAGRELHEAFPVFAKTFDAACAELDRHLAGHVPHSVRRAVFDGDGLGDTVYTQAGLFAIEVATAELLASLGVAPRAVAGHSLGEISAAHVAGVLSLGDAAALVAARGRLMQALPPGGVMTAVAVSEADAHAALVEGVSLAAVNGPDAVVLSGPAEGVDEVVRALGADSRRLRVSHAFHSPLMEPMLDAFREVVAGLTFRAPRIPLVSGVTGAVAGDDVCDPEYWVRQVRATVRFADAVTTMADELTVSAVVEVGPGGTLTGLVPGIVPGIAPAVALLRRGKPELRGLLDGLGRLFVAGHDVRWTELTPPAAAPELPKTVFERRRFWLTGSGHPVVDTVVDVPGGVVLAGAFRGPVTAGALVELALRAADEAECPVLAEFTVAGLPAPGPVRVTVGPERRLAVHARVAGEWVEIAAGRLADEAAIPDVDETFDELSVESSAHIIHPALLDDVTPGEVAFEWRGVRLHAADATTVRARRGQAENGFGLVLSDGAGLPVLTAELIRTRPAERTAPVLHRVELVPSQSVPGRPDPTWQVIRVGGGDLHAVLADVLGTLQTFLTGEGRILVVVPPVEQDPVAAAVAGLVRTAATENPGRIVLARTADDDLLLPPDEPEFVLTGGRVFVPRLRRAEAGAPWQPRGTVLVTGGTGALGSLVARHLVEQHGVRSLVIASRSGEGRAAEGVRHAAVDLVQHDQVRELIDGIPDLRAVVHCAGIVDDGVLSSMDRSRLDAVLGPKIDAAQHLDELTRDRDLDAFVLFSSVSGVLGSAGQAAYAAANAALDALAARRRAAGLPATSIAWGPWEPSGGMTAHLSEVDMRRLARLGLRPLSSAEGLRLLDAAVHAPDPAVIAADLDPAALRGPRTRRRVATEPIAANDLSDLVRREAAAVLGLAPSAVIGTRSFRDAGFDSLMAVELRNRLSAATGLPLPATIVFDWPTPADLAAHLATGTATEEARSRSRADDDPVALVGMAMRLPGGVDTPEAYWRLLADGADAISGFPTDRGWPADLDSITREGGFLRGADLFDAEFFGISPREARAMDPQQRLLLETSWEALERAGFDPVTLRGHELGVFAGASAQPYGSGGPLDGYQLTGTASSVLSGRIAYVLGTRGPAITVDTACSSALVALHLAVQSLRARECGVALAGGVTVLSTPDVFVEFSRQRGLAPDGRCKPFAAAADGTAWSEGVGVLVLQRLSDALAQGREVLAVVRGTAVNSDGASNGLTAPNGPAQERVIRQALADAGLEPSDVDAVEAHGTGTRLGDPIEAQALLATYGRDRATPLWLGSVKSNVGHTQAAAGVVGLMKMVLALRHEMLPRTLHVDRPTDEVDWAAGSVRLLTEPVAWPSDSVRRAAVSAFGVSGTNAHVVLEAPPVREPVPAEPGLAPLVLSGRTPAALAAQAARLADEFPDAPLAAVARSLVATRALREHRAVVFSEAGLRDLTSPDVVMGVARDGGRTVFVFPGQGAQWAGMGRELTSHPVFAARMAECADALGLDDLFGDLDRVDVVQPVSFAVMVSLAAVWESVGVRPDAVIGHSQGEIAAACVAGALSLADAAKIVTLRSRVIAEELAGRGGMLSISLDPHEIDLPAGVEVAVVNSPGATVVAGVPGALEELERRYRGSDVRIRRLPVDYASHTAHVDAVADRIAGELTGITTAPPRVPWMSTVDVKWVDGELAPDYWVRNLRQPVRFADAVAELGSQGYGTFVEVSSHPVLTTAVAATVEDALVVGTLRRDDGGPERLLRSFAELHVGGGALDWMAILPEAPFVPVPPTVFEREHFWRLPARGGGGQDAVAHPVLSAAHEIPDGGGLLLTGRLSVADQPWLADHAVAGMLLVPGAVVVELALQAGKRVGLAVLDELVIETPLVLTGDHEVRVVVGAEQDGGRPVSVHSRDGEQWIRHAAGRLDAEPIEAPVVVWPSEGEDISGAELYTSIVEAGYEYGPSFQGVRTIRRRGAELYAEIVPQDSTEGFLVHPALLDAALHPAALTVRGTAELPFAWRGTTVHGPATGTVRVHLAPEPDGIHVHAVDETGAPVFTVRGLVSRPAVMTTEDVFVLDSVVLPVPASGDPLPDEWRVHRVEPGAGTDGERARRAVLAVVEAIRADESKLVVVTADPADPAVAAVHGLVRCAQAEHPGRILLVDGDLPARQTVEALADEWQITIRDGEVRAPRLVRPVERVEPKPWRGPVLITGGTGTLGAHTARHLVRTHGIRDLVLVSRQGPAADGADELRTELTRAGASVRILAVDITDEDSVRALLTEPFAAVVHTAGALADTALANLDASDLDRTMRPKADAAALLDELTRGTGTALVLYSSAAGVLGNPGQGGYAAANAFLDALARRRAEAGDPALSLAWGLWSETSGLTDGADTARMARAGIVGIATEQGLRMFDAALASGRAVTVPVAIDRTAFGAEPPALWRELIRPRLVAPGRSVLDRITAADPDRREGLLIDLVRREAAVVLRRTGPGGIGPKAAFRDLGFDSLTSVELRNRLSAATGVKLPVTAVFDHPNATELATRLHEGLYPPVAAEPEPEQPPADDSALIAEMSAEELIRRALGEVG